jgi:dolichyl-phosphate beta-glucosyltransferase
MPSVSTAIVVPCFNEEARFDTSRFSSFMEATDDIRFHFVDDGSTDGTGKMLRQMVEAHPGRSRFLELPRNVGKGEAVRRGFLDLFEEPVEFAGFWDADLATPLEAIHSLRIVLAERPELQAVFGARVKLLGRHIERRASRHYAGRIFATVASALLDLKVYDSQCGAKLFRINDTTRKIFREPFKSRWIFDVELLMQLQKEHGREAFGRTVFEYPLMEWHDVGGSNIRFRDFVTAARDLLAIYRMRS